MVKPRWSARRRTLSDIGYGEFIVSPRGSDEATEQLFFAAVSNRNATVALKLKPKIYEYADGLLMFGCRAGDIETVSWMCEELGMPVHLDPKYACQVLHSGNNELFKWMCIKLTGASSLTRVRVLEHCMSQGKWKKGEYLVIKSRFTREEIEMSGWAHDAFLNTVTDNDDVYSMSDEWRVRKFMYESWKQRTSDKL